MNFNCMKTVYQSNKNEGKTLKMHVYQRISQLIDDDKSKHHYSQLIKLFIFELQILINIITACYQYTIHTDSFANFGNSPYSISKLFSIEFFICFGGQESYFAGSLILMLFTILYFIITIYMMIRTIIFQKKRIQSTDFRAKWMKFVIYYHIPIIFYLISNCYIKSFNMLKLYYKDSIDQRLSDIICAYSLLHLFNIALCVFILELATHSLMSHNNDGKRNKIGIYAMVIFQSVFAIINFITGDSIKHLISYCLITIFLFIRTWEIFSHPTYYNLYYMKLTAAFHGINIGIVLIHGICDAIQDITITSTNTILNLMTCINFIICPLMAKLIMGLHKRQVSENLVLKADQTDCVNHIVSKYIYLSDIFNVNYSLSQEQRDTAEYILRGLLVNHLKKCMNCMVKEDIFKLLADLAYKCYDNLEKVKVHILTQILKEGIEHYPTVYTLPLLNLELIVDNTESIHSILLSLNNIQIAELTTNELLTYNILKCKIHNKITIINQNKTLCVDPLIISSKYEDYLINQLSLQAKNHLKWWKIFMNNDKRIDMEDIIKLAKKIDREYSELKNLWNNQSHTYETNSYIRPLLIYGLFLDIIKNNQYESELILKQYYQMHSRINNIDSKYDKISKTNLCSEKNIIMRLTIQKNQLGNIISCSNNIQKVLGYAKSELLQGKFIEEILPKFYKELHKTFVSNYFNTGINQKFTNIMEVYPQHKSGYLVPLSMSATLVPDLIQGVYALSVMRETKMIGDMILITLDGKIIGLTKDLMSKWKVRLEDMSDISIWNICSGLKSIIKLYQEAIKHQINILSESNNLINPKSHSNLEKIPSLKPHDNDNDLKITELENLIKKYNSEGEILEYSIFRSKYDSEYGFYRTMIHIESYQNNISILKLYLQKVENIGNSFTKRCLANTPISLISLRNDSVKNQSSENINTSMLTNHNHHNIDNIINLPFLSTPNATKCNIDIKAIASKENSTIFGIGADNTLRNKFIFPQQNPQQTNSPSKRLDIGSISSPRIELLHQTQNYPQLQAKPDLSQNHQDHPSDHGSKTKEAYYVDKNQENSSYYTRTSSRKHNHYKVHKALEKSYTPKTLRNQLLIFPLIFVVSIIIMVFVGQGGKNVAIDANNYVNMVHITTQRTLNLIELYHRVKILWMIKGNYSDQSHLCYISPNECTNNSPNLTTLIGPIATNLLENTTQIATLTVKLNDDLQEIIYDEDIKLYNMYANGTISPVYSIMVNQFLAIDNIYDQCIQLMKIPYEEITQNTPQLNYILNNTMNKLLSDLPASNTDVISEMNITIRSVTQFLLNSLEIIIPIAFLVWIIVFFTTMKIYRYNKCILHNITKLPSENYSIQVSRINDYITELNNEDNTNKPPKKNYKYENPVHFIKTKSKPKLPKKSISPKKYFCGFFIKLSLLFIIIIFLLFTFVLKYVHRKNLSESRINFVNGVIIGLNQIYYQSLSLVYLYEFIVSNGSSYVSENQPIGLALNSALDKISSQNDFIQSFKFTSEIDTSDIDYLFYRNACALIPPNTLNITQCIDLGSGPSQRGLIGLNSYALEVMSSVKHNFENTDRTSDDVLYNLNLPILETLEQILFTFTVYFYNSLYEMLCFKFNQVSSLIVSSDSIWIGVSTIISIMMTFMLWLPVFIYLLMEYNNIKKVIKMLPKYYILSNLILKKFVLKTAGKTIHLTSEI